MRAYLDIETSFSNELTVIGLYITDSGALIQMVGGGISLDGLVNCLSGVKAIYTYNGNRFDIPTIHRSLGINLRQSYESCDLMYDCWKNNLKGGLKAVERTLGITRNIFGRGEDDPRILWRRYRLHKSLDALERLLEYNREDILNLVLLEKRLKDGHKCKDFCEVPINSYLRFI
ncbi:MAG: ribonuclease H-like domain-containing protein [Actinobacteria bacterium]|nr:ribonuclease H-like domain-containing protein [Actinomycetota bacterium]